MTSSRETVDDLIKIMADARSTVVNNWDVLCSYDLKALNDVLREEYEKNPVNSRIRFSLIKEVAWTKLNVSCDVQLDNPTLEFSTVQSGTYNFNIPIKSGSRCTQTLNNESRDIEIPEGYAILTSGPIRTVIGTGINQTVYETDEVVEFGDREQANVVLHFGDKLRNVKVVPKSDSGALNEIFKDITNYFDENVTEVDYNIVQVVKQPENHEGLVLTPKSFIITTQADQDNLQNGALNIWIQTNESGQPKGNGQPSFYPDKNVLPVPKNFTSSIYFSHRLMNDLYLKPALESYYDTYITDANLNNTMYPEVVALVPKNDIKQNINLNFQEGVYDKSYEYEIDYKNSPYQVLTHEEKLKWIWKFETPLKKFEIIHITDAEIFVVKWSSYVVGWLPLAALLPRYLDSLKKSLKLIVEIEKNIDFEIIDNTKFSAKINLQKEDLKVYVQKIGGSGPNLFRRSEEVNWDDVKNVL